MSYFLHLVIHLEIYLLVATSLNLLIGYGGLLQVAHAAYFGVGAYGAAILALEFGLGFVPGILLGGCAAAALSFLVSIPALRLHGHAFVLISIAVQLSLYALMFNWIDLTRGPFGLAGISAPAILGVEFATEGLICILYGLVVGGSILLLGLLKQSPFGRGLQALRDDEVAAISLGIPARRLKVQAFAVAAGMVGVAGALYAPYATYIDPTSFSLNESILMLSMVIIGGTGNIRGPLVGAVTLVTLPELLRVMEFPDALAGNLRLLVYGLLLILMMRFRPQGLAGRYRFE